MSEPDPTSLPTAIAIIRSSKGLSIADTAMKQTLAKLSRPEMDVYRLLLTDLDERAIATKLGYSVHTVRAYRRLLYRKMGVRSRYGLYVPYLDVAKLHRMIG